MRIPNVVALACCVTLLRTGWAAPPLDTIERIVPGCRATVSKDARISAMTEFNFPSNTVVTVSRVEGNRGFFKVVQFGGTMEAACLLEHMTRVYSDEEQKLLLEKRKLDMERVRISAQQSEWEKQRKEREVTQAAKQGRIEGTVTFSWSVSQGPSRFNGRMDEIGNIQGRVEVTPPRRPGSRIVAYQQRPAPQSEGGWVGRDGRPAVSSRLTEVASTAPDSSGRFSLALDPGDYDIVCMAENRPGVIGGGNYKSIKVRVESERTANCSFSF